MRIGVLSAGNIDRYQSQSALHYIKSGTGGSKERYTGGKKNNCMCCNAETERERERKQHVGRKEADIAEECTRP